MNQPNPLMFRAYDIRGVADDDLTEEAAVIIGKGIGTYLQRRGGNQIVVGRDNRLSSERLKNSLVEGLLSTGCAVTDIGQSTSPMMYAAVIQWGLDGGINVTGSHNPKEYNGFKVVGRQAFPIGGPEIEVLRDLTLAEDFLGGRGAYRQGSILEEYFAKIQGLVHLARPMKVAVDTGNGVAGLAVPEMLKRLGCEVVEIYTELDGNFPHHLPNPEKESSLAELKRQVVVTGAEVGLGFDGDGDRVGLIDEQGGFREADYVIMLLARDYLSRHPGAPVLVDVKISQNVINDIRQHNGLPVLSKTGHSLVKQKMREDHIILGGELSGHMFVFEDYYPVDDALYAAGRLLQYLSTTDKSVSAQFADLPKLYASRIIEIPCADHAKFDVIKQLQAAFAARYEVNTIDGARVTFPHGWAIVRASNTTPNLTLRYEADSPEHLEEIRDEVMATVNAHLPKN
ncbi:MAG: phosphomannomutase/phosphoglucomutase [Chloroflexota bacterium]